MRYEDPQGEAALRYDRWGTRRGLPYAADPAWDDSPGRGPAPDAGAWVGGGGGGWAGSANRWDEPSRGFAPPGPRDGEGAGSGGGWDGGIGGYGDDGYDADDDGYVADAGPLYRGPWLPPRVWMRWRRRPWFPRFYGMIRRARPAGVLRHRGTGARYPVFRGRMGGRGWRVVTRPRGMRYEVVGLEAETGVPNEAEYEYENESEYENVNENESESENEGESEGESEMLALPGAGASTSSGYAPADLTSRPGGGYRLRLPHQGVHTILARLRPEQLRTLTGGALPADPAAAVARGVGRVARRARRLGRLRGRRAGSGLEVFGTPGFRLLVRPTGEMEGEILAVTPVAGEMEVYADRQPGYRRSVGGKEYRVRGAHATVTWSRAEPVAGAASLRPPASAVYVLLKDNQPIYVGESSSWSTRWRARLQALAEFGIPTTPYTVAVGSIAWSDPGQPAPKPDLLRTEVEHLLVRGLMRAGIRLNNRRSIEPVLPAPRGFRVVNAGVVPRGVPPVLQPAGQDTPYELEG